jgi:hypothetical protein
MAVETLVVKAVDVRVAGDAFDSVPFETGSAFRPRGGLLEDRIAVATTRGLPVFECAIWATNEP